MRRIESLHSKKQVVQEKNILCSQISNFSPKHTKQSLLLWQQTFPNLSPQFETSPHFSELCIILRMDPTRHAAIQTIVRTPWKFLGAFIAHFIDSTFATQRLLTPALA